MTALKWTISRTTENDQSDAHVYKESETIALRSRLREQLALVFNSSTGRLGPSKSNYQKLIHKQIRLALDGLFEKFCPVR